MLRTTTMRCAALLGATCLMLAGCGRDWGAGGGLAAGSARPAEASRGTDASALTGAAALPGRATGDPSMRAGTPSFAALPDAGDLIGYPRDRTRRREGAYTWHRADVSEAHALRAIVDGELRFTAPDGTLLAFEYERHVEHATGDWTWVGRLKDAPPGRHAIVTFGSDAVFGTIGREAGEPLRLAMRDGRSWLVETDTRLLAGVERRALHAGTPDYLIPPSVAHRVAPASAASQAQAMAWLEPTSDSSTGTQVGTVVDVLVGYTPGFASAQGGATQARTRINYLAEVANQGYINSGIDGRVRIVHAMQVNYPDATTNGEALEKLTGYASGEGYTTPDPVFSSLRSARETYGADLVTLVRDFNTPENEGCGIAWLIGGGMGEISPGYEYFGYSVVSDGTDPGNDGKNYYCRDETFVHELGHNMGAAHDRETAKGDDGVLDNPDDYGRYTYSFGYRTSAGSGDFFTIMAYPEDRSSGPEQVPYRTFSNPNSTFCGGFRCGTVNDDNARGLRQTIGVIAGFRASVVPETTGDAINDINGDGRSDLLWFKWGLFQGWRMDGRSVTSVVNYTPSSDMYPYVTGSFNAQAGQDIAWRDGNGRLIFWVNDANGYRRSNVEYPMSFGWRLQAAGDRNGDGVSDLIWRSAVDGRVMYWHMAANQSRISYRAFAQEAAMDIVTTGDFNADGATDLFFRRRSDGRTVIWIAQGVGYTTTSPGSISKYWVPVNSGDFDGDGDDDIVWRSQIDQRVMVWLMQGGLRVDLRVFASSAAQELLGSADLNGDGLMDLVWRDDAGTVSAWIGTGTTFTNGGVGAIDPSWKYVRGGR